MSPVVPLLLVTILLCPLSPEAQEYYVTPTPPPNPDCPLDQPCHTLSYYASNASSLFNNKENLSLLFMDGVHNLDISLVISQVQSLTIAGVNESLDNGNPRASIQLHLLVNNVSVFKVENIKLQQTSLIINDVEWFINQNAVYNYSTLSIMSATTKGVLITGSMFLGSLFRSTFNGNHSTTVQIANTVSLGAYLRYNTFGFTLFTSTEISIANSTFGNNSFGLLFEVNRASNITILDSAIINNRLGLVIFYQNNQVRQQTLDLKIESSQFIGNPVAFVCIPFNSVNSLVRFHILFRNISVINNFANGAGTTGIVTITGPATLNLDSCLFDNNTGVTVLQLSDVDLHFLGNTTFSNNTGISGGAMVLSNTTMWLDIGTHIRFINNTASEVGGAIWVTSEIPLSVYAAQLNYPPCFYQLTSDLVEPLNNQTIPVSITFSGNKARTGGDDIYGAALQSNCKMTPNRQISSYQVQQKIFQFDTRTLSSISSNPKRVCLCESKEPVCVIDTSLVTNYLNVSVTPGEKFNLSVALVGNDFGLVTGGVYALDTSGEDVSFFTSPGEKLQQITDLRCTDIEYSIHPVSENSKNNEGLLLSTDSISASTQRVIYQRHRFLDRYKTSVQRYLSEAEISTFILTAPVVVEITILPCPLGLSLSEGTYKTCQCRTEITEFVERCAVINNNGVFYRQGTSWIGTSPLNNSTIANKNCHFGYCKPEKLGVNLDNPDIQCALNHSGVLCGGCPPGLSRAIGSSRCIDCPDNNGVALLVVFIVAGVALVLFIKLLDITVAHGTINGLILYANIIWINQGIFFPLLREQTKQNLSNLYYFLRVFVAWLNLDFGIETCFIKGLDAYGKIWLQFVFPIYLWLIALLIVLLCRYSTKATKIFGSNAVAVLTTMLMLSYTKLQRTIVLSLQYSKLSEFNPNDRQLVWTFDGNVKYFGSVHAGLFLVVIAVSIFLCLPFILTLLFAGHLHRLPCASIASRAIKSRPLLDTFTGTLKAKHQYWVGLTFFIRGALVILAAFLETAYPTVYIDLVVLVSALLCTVALKVYKKKYLNALEFVFLFNLVVLGVAFLSTDDPESRVVCTCISVAISFLIFVGIVVYHLYLIVSKCYKARKVQEPENTIQQQPIKTVTTYDVDMGDFLTTSWIEFREDILESNI